jgi:hypothetical protein
MRGRNRRGRAQQPGDRQRRDLGLRQGKGVLTMDVRRGNDRSSSACADARKDRAEGVPQRREAEGVDFRSPSRAVQSRRRTPLLPWSFDPRCAVRRRQGVLEARLRDRPPPAQSRRFHHLGLRADPRALVGSTSRRVMKTSSLSRASTMIASRRWRSSASVGSSSSRRSSSRKSQAESPVRFVDRQGP